MLRSSSVEHHTFIACEIVQELKRPRVAEQLVLTTNDTDLRPGVGPKNRECPRLLPDRLATLVDVVRVRLELHVPVQASRLERLFSGLQTVDDGGCRVVPRKTPLPHKRTGGRSRRGHVRSPSFVLLPLRLSYHKIVTWYTTNEKILRGSLRDCHRIITDENGLLRNTAHVDDRLAVAVPVMLEPMVLHDRDT